MLKKSDSVKNALLIYKAYHEFFMDSIAHPYEFQNWLGKQESHIQKPVNQLSALFAAVMHKKEERPEVLIKNYSDAVRFLSHDKKVLKELKANLEKEILFSPELSKKLEEITGVAYPSANDYIKRHSGTIFKNKDKFGNEELFLFNEFITVYNNVKQDKFATISLELLEKLKSITGEELLYSGIPLALAQHEYIKRWYYRIRNTFDSYYFERILWQEYTSVEISLAKLPNSIKRTEALTKQSFPNTQEEQLAYLENHKADAIKFLLQNLAVLEAMVKEGKNLPELLIVNLKQITKERYPSEIEEQLQYFKTNNDLIIASIPKEDFPSALNIDEAISLLNALAPICKLFISTELKEKLEIITDKAYPGTLSDIIKYFAQHKNSIKEVHNDYSKNYKLLAEFNLLATGAIRLNETLVKNTQEKIATETNRPKETSAKNTKLKIKKTYPDTDLDRYDYIKTHYDHIQNEAEEMLAQLLNQEVNFNELNEISLAKYIEDDFDALLNTMELWYKDKGSESYTHFLNIKTNLNSSIVERDFSDTQYNAISALNYQLEPKLFQFLLKGIVDNTVEKNRSYLNKKITEASKCEGTHPDKQPHFFYDKLDALKNLSLYLDPVKFQNSVDEIINKKYLEEPNYDLIQEDEQPVQKNKGPYDDLQPSLSNQVQPQTPSSDGYPCIPIFELVDNKPVLQVSQATSEIVAPKAIDNVPISENIENVTSQYMEEAKRERLLALEKDKEDKKHKEKISIYKKAQEGKEISPEEKTQLDELGKELYQDLHRRIQDILKIKQRQMPQTNELSVISESKEDNLVKETNGGHTSLNDFLNKSFKSDKVHAVVDGTVDHSVKKTKHHKKRIDKVATKSKEVKKDSMSLELHARLITILEDCKSLPEGHGRKVAEKIMTRLYNDILFAKAQPELKYNAVMKAAITHACKQFLIQKNTFSKAVSVKLLKILHQYIWHQYVDDMAVSSKEAKELPGEKNAALRDSLINILEKAYKLGGSENDLILFVLIEDIKNMPQLSFDSQKDLEKLKKELKSFKHYLNDNAGFFDTNQGLKSAIKLCLKAIENVNSAEVLKQDKEEKIMQGPQIDRPF